MWLNVVQIRRVVEHAGLHQAKQKPNPCARHLDVSLQSDFYASMEGGGESCIKINKQMPHCSFSNVFFFALHVLIISNSCCYILHGLYNAQSCIFLCIRATYQITESILLPLTILSFDITMKLNISTMFASFGGSTHTHRHTYCTRWYVAQVCRWEAWREGYAHMDNKYSQFQHRLTSPGSPKQRPPPGVRFNL